MDRQAMWRSRVRAWRESGLSLAEFGRGKDYTGSGLGYWVRRLDEEPPGVRSKASRDVLSFARVVRSPHGSRAAAGASMERPSGSHPAGGSGALHVEVGALRVQVPGGLEAARLQAVLDAVVRASKAGSP
jgi:hypothetical protein